MPAAPSSATTFTSSSSSRSSAKRCSLLCGRMSHAGSSCGTTESRSGRRRTSTDWLPERSTPYSFTLRASSTGWAPSGTPSPSPPYRASMTEPSTSSSSKPRPCGPRLATSSGSCSRACSPKVAAFTRTAVSLLTMVTGGPSSVRWPSAAPMMRLSAFSGSRPCSLSRLVCTPFSSTRMVPPPGSGHGWRRVAARLVAEALDHPQQLPGRHAHRVEALLEAVELLDHGERDDQVGAGVGVEHAVGVGHQRRGVEDDGADGEDHGLVCCGLGGDAAGERSRTVGHRRREVLRLGLRPGGALPGERHSAVTMEVPGMRAHAARRRRPRGGCSEERWANSGRTPGGAPYASITTGTIMGLRLVRELTKLPAARRTTRWRFSMSMASLRNASAMASSILASPSSSRSSASGA